MAEGYEGYQGYGAGGYGSMDPATMRSRLAMAMLQQGSDSSPIRSKWQGAARLSQALMGALMLRQQQDAYGDSWKKALSGMPTGLPGTAGAVAGGMGSPGLPAQPGALADLANDPDIMHGVANAATNGLPDTATIGASLARGPSAPLMGPMPATMAPNNAAGGAVPGGPMPGSAIPAGGPNFNGPSQGAMVGSIAPRLDPRMMVAGPGAPSFIPPASGNSPQGAGAGAFNPEDLAMFQEDMKAVPGTSGGGAAGGGILDQLKANIAKTESGGNYAAIGPDTGNGNHALGKYQVMASNVPSWTKEILGQEMTPQQFLASPQAQEAVATGKLGSYLQQYGPAGAARAWFTGSPVGKGADVNGMTGDRYAALATQGMGAPGAAGPLAFNGAPPQNAPALAAIQGAAPAPNVPASMQPHMMVAGPGAPPNAPANSPRAGDLGSPQAIPPDAGGGNPLGALGSGLQNMFGLANPSSPQGGNAPAPAGNGVPGEAANPHIQQLMQVLSDPYAAPGAKQVAMQFLQYYMPHPTTWEALPGTNNLAEKNWMGQFTGRVMQGQHETSVVDMGTDIMGVKHQGIFDKNAPLGHQLTPINPSGAAGAMPDVSQMGASGAGAAPAPIPATPGQSAAPGAQEAPKTWEPGQPIDPAAEQRLQSLTGQYSGGDPRAQAELYQYAKALLQGNQQFVAGGTIAKSPMVQAAETIARQIDPDGMPQTRFDTIKANADTSSPTSLGGQRMAAQTSVRHLGSLAEASDLLGQQGQISSSEMGAELQNWAQRNLGGASSKFTTASQAYNAALVPVLGEIDKLYKGGQATEGEINEMKENLAPTASPAARQAALTMLSGLLEDKVNVLQNTWHMGVGSKFPDLQIVDKRGQEALDYIKKWGSPPVLPNSSAQGGGSPSGGNDPLSQARAAIAKGAPRAAVIQRLQQMGVNPSGL